MNSIHNSSQVHPLGTFRSSFDVEPELGNMDIAVGISLLSCVKAEVYVNYYPLLVKIGMFDSSQFHTSGILCSGLVVLPDPENMGIAVEMTLLPPL